MGKQTIPTTQSALEKLNIAFEYDITWAAAKKAVRERTI